MEIEVLRIGQRVVRDDRVTTHVALVSRALGASRIYMDEVNPEIVGTVQKINDTWGGDFEVVTIDGWKKTLRTRIADGFAAVHLTMYGEPVAEACRRIAAEGDRRILVVVGAEKVPGDVYGIAKYNVSVSGQPHSEIGALAVLLDRLQEGRQFDIKFGNAKRTIIPAKRGKNVATAGGGTPGAAAEGGAKTGDGPGGT